MALKKKAASTKAAIKPQSVLHDGIMVRPEPGVAPRTDSEKQLQAFDRAVQLFRKQQFREAKPVFEEAASGPQKEIAHNAKMHVRMCESRLEKPVVALHTLDDHYNYAIERLNARDMEKARQHLDCAMQLVRKNKENSPDHVYYALALCASISRRCGRCFRKSEARHRPEPQYPHGRPPGHRPCPHSAAAPNSAATLPREAGGPILNEPLRVVAIGGGTGLSALLKGLKRYAPLDITAVVTVTDDGGSSGRLRRDFEILPPGDIRNCMVALSEDEALLSRLFQYRFASGQGLAGHSFGNLFLAALTHITGEFSEAVKQSSRALAIMGSIYPSTSRNVQLEAELVDGTIVRGETKISRSRKRILRIHLDPRVCRPLPETLAAIANADVITLGPGSLFTSVIPNLLVSGVAKAIAKSPAVKAYFVNLMWQPGETIEFRASDHILAVQKHARVPKLIDYAVVNESAIGKAALRRYEATNVRPVENDVETIRAMGIEVVSAGLIEKGPQVRHSPEATAAVAVELAREGRRRRQ